MVRRFVVMRNRLRTLLILLLVMPPMLSTGWGKYQSWRAERELQRAYSAANRMALSIRPAPPPVVFTVRSGTNEVLKSLGPPPPGSRWIKNGNGVAAGPVNMTDDELATLDRP